MNAARSRSPSRDAGARARDGAVGPALEYARRERRRFVGELVELVRFPSVGAQPEHREDVRRCAAWLADHLRGIGLSASVISTPGHPIVRAEKALGSGRPTVLVYGHYDVQPAEPLERWQSPPFQPVVRDGHLFGRGAADDKGQLWAHVKAIECLLKTSGRLPVDVICLFEGEEETGSTHLLEYLRRNAHALPADVAVLSDMRMRSADVPAVTYALRGALNLELEVRGPREDLHSGLFGGAVLNPIQALCEIVAKLHDERGGVAIPGFYDALIPVRPGERAYLRRTGPTDAEILDAAGAKAGWGESGYSLYERSALRPALTVNGVGGGYTGPGSKSVIPARAVARIGFRLAPGQDPSTVEALFRHRVARIAPVGVETVVRSLFGARPALIDPTGPAVSAAVRSLEESFGRRPVLVRSGGTIPVVNAIIEGLGIPALLIGLARPDARLHAPNERFHLPTLFRGIDASIRLLHRIGRIPGRGRAWSTPHVPGRRE